MTLREFILDFGPAIGQFMVVVYLIIDYKLMYGKKKNKSVGDLSIKHSKTLKED